MLFVSSSLYEFVLFLSFSLRCLLRFSLSCKNFLSFCSAVPFRAIPIARLAAKFSRSKLSFSSILKCFIAFAVKRI